MPWDSYRQPTGLLEWAMRRNADGAARADTPAGDLTTPRAESWPAFRQALTKVLCALRSGHVLVLEHKRSGYAMRFASRGESGFRLEAIFNAALPPAERLGETETTFLARLGWHRTFTDEAIGLDPAAPPCFAKEWPGYTPTGEIAGFAVATLRDVFGIAHPCHLNYAAHASADVMLEFSDLGIDRAVHATDPPPDEIRVRHPGTRRDLQTAVARSIREITGLSDLGDVSAEPIVISGGGFPFIVNVDERKPFVEILAIAVLNVGAAPNLLDALNTLNDDHDFARFVARNGHVVAIWNVDCSPFVPSVFGRALRGLRDLVITVAESLQTRFGGEMPFGAREANDPQPSGDMCN